MNQFADQGVTNELSVRSAFQNLLTKASSIRKWSLIAELSDKSGGKLTRPDATIRDKNYLPRGYWEAKDIHDDIDLAIKQKKDSGYPLTNIIFENTQVGVLYQNKREAIRVDLTDPKELANLLNLFINYSEPEIEGFDKAVAEFKDRVPELAHGLKNIISEAHTSNPDFQRAFDKLYLLCTASLNPNLRREAVDEMVIQHLLTERLIQQIFNPDFLQKNIIAVEVEKVIVALTLHSFSRRDYLEELDRFYKAIEDAARHVEDFNERLRILNTVYEQFFQGYAVDVADTHGIVYTPNEIVDFMCASVVEALKTEFGKSFGDEDVVLLDPCTGTGSFIVNLLNRVEKRHLDDLYTKRLFANEVMLMPYYIASLNIEHTFYELTGRYKPFEGICFVDTLDLVGQQRNFFLNEPNSERIDRERDSNITVIIGNPPYNAGQQNENDNNKNRKYNDKEQGLKAIDVRIKNTYSADSAATLNRYLYDPYVRFFRWATDRLEGRDGIVCFVTNNSYFDAVAFDGFRKHLEQEYDNIYHFDFKGNARTSGVRRRKEGGNIFLDQIRVGVGITILIRKKNKDTIPKVFYHAVDDYWKEKTKTEYLRSFQDYNKIEWNKLTPDNKHNWILSGNSDQFESFITLGDSKNKHIKDAESVFLLYSLGVATNRDSFVYDYSEKGVYKKVSDLIQVYNGQVGRALGQKQVEDIDQFVSMIKEIKWTHRLKQELLKRNIISISNRKIRNSLYRPYSKQFLYFDHLLNERRYQQHHIFPTSLTEQSNRVICVSGIGSNKPFQALITNCIPCLDILEKTQCFPFYTYDPDGTNRRENITDTVLNQFRDHYLDSAIQKWDIFYYVYGLLHHPTYRETFKDCLKRDLPRIPFAPDFKAFMSAGTELADLHLNYETVKPYELEWVESPDTPMDWKVNKMKLTKDKASIKYNDWLTLKGIPPETFEYRLGNRSALDWIIDQYRVKTDKRSGIVSDPNQPDNERYIVDLIGKIVHVSLETVWIVNGLPDKCW